MWNLMMYPVVADAALDFTAVLSPLLVGLHGVVWLSAGMIVYVTFHHYLAERFWKRHKIVVPPERQRDAA
jgi:hypothetical protein